MNGWPRRATTTSSAPVRSARVIQEHIKKPLAEEILFGALKDGGTVRVVVEEKDGEKGLGFEYIKPDAPIKPRDPEDDESEGTETSAKAAKPRAKKARKPRGGSKPGPSAVPKVPLGED